MHEQLNTRRQDFLYGVNEVFFDYLVGMVLI